MTGLVVVQEDAGVTLAHDGPLIAWAYRSLVQKEWMLRCGDLFAELSAKHPGGLLMCTIVAQSVPAKVDAETRGAATSVTTKWQHTLRGSSTVIEGTGFWAATARGIVSGVQFMGGLKCPSHTGATLEDAATWLSGLAFPGTPPPERLLADLRRVRGA